MPFDPFTAVALLLADRMVMAPMTRSPATPVHVPDAADESTFDVPGAKGCTDDPALAA